MRKTRHVDDVQNKEFIADAEKLNPIIIYNEPEIPEIHNKSLEFPPIEEVVFCGDGVRTSNWQTICAVGLWVRSILDSTYYIMTAGHCYDNGPFNPDGSVDFYHFPWMGSVVNDVAPGFIGPMAQPNLSVVDKAFILKQNDNIRVTASVRNTDDQNYPELMIYGSAVIDTVGAIVCKSGYFSHVQCGRILEIGAQFNFLKDGEVVEYSGLTKVEKIAFQGDSGGPVYGYELSLLPGIIIAGILSSGNLDIVNDWNVFTPIDMLITSDIEIITVGNL
ncbi:S1 family peptidase [Gigaspora margarita]|uniref:S1 family peptidase n=1 Tax=Gigaspora margarita TaxID=4874 RepID=A0A8H4ALC0_GIGMA|nr:S1 family peptidase [Gigaspora margarita]